MIGCLVAGGLLVGGCLKPNPFLEADTESGSTSTTTEGMAGSGSTTDPSTSSSTTTTTSGDPASTGGDPSESDSTTGPVECDGGSLCAAPVPNGWSGPVIVAAVPRDDGSTPDCPAEYPDAALAQFQELSADDAVCGCTCGAPSDVTCGTAQLEAFGSSSSCAAGIGTEDVSTSGCTPISTMTSEYWEASAASVTGGTCAPDPQVTVEPFEFETLVAACGGATATRNCEGGGECVPAPNDPFAARACIHQDGDLECPPGPYAEKILTYGGADDTRDCSTCTCGTATGQCTGDVRLSTDSCSTFTGGDIPTSTTCTGSTAMVSINGARFVPTDNDAACAPTVGQPMGEATANQPVTICCS